MLNQEAIRIPPTFPKRLRPARSHEPLFPKIWAMAASDTDSTYVITYLFVAAPKNLLFHNPVSVRLRSTACHVVCWMAADWTTFAKCYQLTYLIAYVPHAASLPRFLLARYLGSPYPAFQASRLHRPFLFHNHGLVGRIDNYRHPSKTFF